MTTWWQIILLSALAFWMIIDQLTVCWISNPLCIGMISGLIMGNLQTGLIVGAALQLMVLGVSTYGGASMPDFLTGAIIGTVYAIGANKGTQFAIGLAVPVGLLMVQLDVLARFTNTIFQKRIDRFITQNKPQATGRNAYLGLFTWGISRSLPVFVLLIVGNRIIKNVLATVPTWLTNGLKVSGGILPVVGIAILLRYLPTKKYFSYLLIGFIAEAYLKLPMLGVALLGIALALLNYQRKQAQSQTSNSHNTEYENEAGEYEN